MHEQFSKLVRDIHSVVTVDRFIRKLKRMLTIDFDAEGLLELLQLIGRKASLKTPVLVGLLCRELENRVAEQYFPHSPQVIFNLQRRWGDMSQILWRRRLRRCDHSRPAISVALHIGKCREAGSDQYCRGDQDELTPPQCIQQ